MPHYEASSTWLGATWTRELKPTEHVEVRDLSSSVMLLIM